MITHETTMEIKEYSNSYERGDALLALMDYYGKTNLMNISEEQALAFLALLESGRSIRSIMMEV